MHERNVIVLTMRTQFYQQIKESFRQSFAHTVFVKPFTPGDIYEFLMRWPFDRDDKSPISKIYDELTDRPTLREMCTNPLVLSMYVAEAQVAGRVTAPESRTEFTRRSSTNSW
jgi:hypothetical protein